MLSEVCINPTTIFLTKLDSRPRSVRGYDGTRMGPNINFRACTRILAIRLTKGSDRRLSQKDEHVSLAWLDDCYY